MAAKTFKTKKSNKTPKEHKEQYEKDYAQIIIDALKEGRAPWTKPWSVKDFYTSMPFNAITKQNYQGSNLIHLATKSMVYGYSDPRWLTFLQAKQLGAVVRKGEKGTAIVYFGFAEDKNKDEELKSGDTQEKAEDNKRAFWRFSVVFNAQQIDGMPELDLSKYDKDSNYLLKEFKTIENAEQILTNSKAQINYGYNKAYYAPLNDYIALPDKRNFLSEESFYSTALHELGHWTGHQTRLKRDLTGRFGTSEYAREELRAEIASFMLGQQLLIEHNPEHHMDYIADWIKILENDPKEIFRAVEDAKKIVKYILQFSPTLKIQNSNILKNNDKKEIERKDIMSLKDVNSVDYNPQEYVELCKKEINKTADALDNIKFENLPVENNREIYADLCKKAISNYSYVLHAVNFDWLPVENNREIYLDLCKEAVKKEGFQLQYVNFDWLPLENNRELYSKLCFTAIKNLTNCSYANALKHVKFENLPIENNKEIYFQLCKEAVQQNGVSFKFIEFKNLPEENNKQIYAKLADMALMQENDEGHLDLVLKYLDCDLLPEKNKNEIYLDLCQKAVSKCGKAIYFVEFENLPKINKEQNYFNLCKKAVIEDSNAISQINFANLPHENKEQCYLELCKEAIKSHDCSWILDCIEYDKLPKENFLNNYIQLCQLAITSNESAIYEVKIEYLPKSLQEAALDLNDNDFKNVILNYTPSVDNNLDIF